MKPYEPENLPIADIDWVGHLPAISRATAALSRYDGMLQSIVNPAVLLSPLTAQEAVLSSRIEGTQASMEEVLEYEADPEEKITPEKHADIQEIMNYRRAMGRAVRLLIKRPLCLNSIKELHRVLLDSTRGRNKSPGEFRCIQNFIGPPGSHIEEATFVPPSPEKLPAALDNWEKYLHYKEKEPLVQLAVAKAQFELLHPFLDGNGRLGRMLVPIFLFEKKALAHPVFYISAYFEKNRDDYYAALQGISRERDWNRWVGFFLKAVRAQANVNMRKTKEVLALHNDMKQRLPEIIRSQYAVQTIDALFGKPFFTIADFTKRSGIQKDSARRIVYALRDNGAIVEVRAGKGRRAAVLKFQALLDIANDV